MIRRQAALALAATFLVATSSASAGCLDGGKPRDGQEPSEPADPPSWDPGTWWRYNGSDGITYTYTYEAREAKEGHESYRFRIDLSEPDEQGTQRYTYWYAVSHMGAVAEEQGPVYVKHDCPAGAWFPLDQAVEDDCGMTWYYHGAFLERYEEKSAKVPVGWENLSLPAGQFAAYKFQLQDRNSNRTVSTLWYGPDVEFLVQWVADSGVTYRLREQGTGTTPGGS